MIEAIIFILHTEQGSKSRHQQFIALSLSRSNKSTITWQWLRYQLRPPTPEKGVDGGEIKSSLGGSRISSIPNENLPLELGCGTGGEGWGRIVRNSPM